MPAEKTNVVVIIVDTLRLADVGCYGNEHIRTPNIDALARRSVRFTRAYPESLPTIPVRRALHTARRAFPFRDYEHKKWGTVRMPGWQPIPEDEDTLAENLAAAGYQTGFVCTTQHCWNPGFNFQRGFWQWEFVRGYSGEDRWASPFSVPFEVMARYGSVEKCREQPHNFMRAPTVLANRGVTMIDEETATARAFQWAARFLADNRKAPFYLLIDSFAPHEPWEAPAEYYKLYADPNYKGSTRFCSCYGPGDAYPPGAVNDMHAHYRGLVTHVDRWLGLFIETLDKLDLSAKTVVLLVSDHGTNFGENPRNVIGKPADSMYPGVMRLPLLARLPGEPGAGKVCDELVYNFDVAATVYDLTGVASPEGITAQSLRPLCEGTGGWQSREYATCRYSDSLCYVDETTWALGDIDGRPQEIFDLRRDPDCLTPLAGDEADRLWQRAWQRLRHDAGGAFPDYRARRDTDAVGRGGGGTGAG